jgi:hypothetical protein
MPGLRLTVALRRRLAACGAAAFLAFVLSSTDAFACLSPLLPKVFSSCIFQCSPYFLE